MLWFNFYLFCSKRWIVKKSLVVPVGATVTFDGVEDVCGSNLVGLHVVVPGPGWGGRGAGLGWGCGPGGGLGAIWQLLTLIKTIIINDITRNVFIVNLISVIITQFYFILI